MVKMYYFLLILLNVFDDWVCMFQLSITAYNAHGFAFLNQSFFFFGFALLSGQCIMKSNFIF